MTANPEWLEDIEEGLHQIERHKIGLQVEQATERIQNDLIDEGREEEQWEMVERMDERQLEVYIKTREWARRVDNGIIKAVLERIDMDPEPVRIPSEFTFVLEVARAIGLERTQEIAESLSQQGVKNLLFEIIRREEV